MDEMVERIQANLTSLTAARDQARMQLNGLENQLYALNQLLNPTPVPEPLPEAEEAPPDQPQGVEMPEGTV